MKKIALILLIVNSFLFKTAFAQDSAAANDSLAQLKKSLAKPGWKILREYISVLPGFDVESKNKGAVTIGMPVGFNFRAYNKNNYGRTFFDFDVSGMALLVNQNFLTEYLKISAGLGFSAENTNNEVHFSYMQNFQGISNMIGFGYDFETISIPLTIDFDKPVKTKNYFLLIGIKVPLASIKF